MTTLKPVLYAEDDENDVFLMERAFNKLRIPNPLRVVTDGSLAIAYLSGTAPFEKRMEDPLPCLILLDLKMPLKNGLEVLRWLKGDPALSTLPVVVLTSSNQESDICQAYQLGASGFITKPGEPNILTNIVSSLQNYWLTSERPSVDFIDFAAEQKIPLRPKLSFPAKL